MYSEIHTSRLILKPITPAVIHDLYNTKSKQEIISFFGFDEIGYEHFKNMHEKGMETYRISAFFFLLIDKETHRPIGECGFHTWNKTHRRTELFYLLRNDEYKQKGLMTEALKAVLEFGFTQLDLHRIEALVADWNTPSVKLLQHYKFTKEGTMREDYCVNGKNENSDCYSLLKWEWEKHNQK
jgi:[ribosomal protein S5]-alanine N-acetyltransferase